MAHLLRIGRVYYSDLRISGRRIQRALSTDKRIAEEKLGELVKQRNAARHGHIVADTSWAALKARLFRELKTMSPVTYRHYARTIREIEDYRTIRQTAEVTPALLQELQVHWKEKKRGLYVRNRDVENVKSMMRRAHDWGMAQRHDWKRIAKSEPEPRGRLHYFSVEELGRIVAATSGLYRTITLLGTRAGLRRGEMLHLEWRDVDFQNNRIHIVSKPEMGWSVKNYESRYVPISDDLRAHLEDLPRASSFVLAGDGGRRYTAEVLSTYFRRILRRLKLKGSLHTLRHSFASHLVQNGVSLYALSKLLGHKSVTTSEIYAHLASNQADADIKKLPGLPTG